MSRSPVAAIVALALIGCQRDDVVASTSDLDDSGTWLETGAVAPDPGDDLSGIEDYPCFSGMDGCAESGPYLADTCCAYGDNIGRDGTAK